MIEITLAKEIDIEAHWYGVNFLIGFGDNNDANERAIRKTRLAVFDQYQTGLDRFSI